MKRLLMHLSLSQKILVAPVVVICFLLASGIVSYWSLSHQKIAIEEIFGIRFKSLQTSAGLIKDATSVHASLYKVISWANANYDAQKIDALGKEQIKILDQALALVDQVIKTKKLAPEEDRSYKTIKVSLADYRKDAFEAIDLAGTDVNYATTFMEKAEQKFQSLYKELSTLLEIETKLGQLTYDGALRNYNTSLQASLLVLVVAIVISILLSLLIAKLIAAPVGKAIAVIQKIAEGDLTQTIEMSSKDEIGLLCQSVDIMRQKMGEAVGGSVETSQVLSEAASEQAASIEETSSSLEEMASMIKSNASSTSKANELMHQAEGTIDKANTSMNQLTVSMKEIAVASEQTQKIVKTIDEIAFQTNLLALNAAVEAARAGEAGSGFAVVAEEVRNLALRASDAAKNSSTLMSDIAKKINAGERLVHATNQDFADIKARSDEVVKLMGSIAISSKEQSEGIEQINQAILQMNQTTQQNAASSEELASIMAVFITEAGSSKRPMNHHGKKKKGAQGDEEKLLIPA